MDKPVGDLTADEAAGELARLAAALAQGERGLSHARCA